MCKKKIFFFIYLCKALMIHLRTKPLAWSASTHPRSARPTHTSPLTREITHSVVSRRTTQMYVYNRTWYDPWKTPAEDTIMFLPPFRQPSPLPVAPLIIMAITITRFV